MLRDRIIRAWKDPDYRMSLSEEERAEVPENPAGAIELTDEELDLATGGHYPSASWRPSQSQRMRPYSYSSRPSSYSSASQSSQSSNSARLQPYSSNQSGSSSMSSQSSSMSSNSYSQRQSGSWSSNRSWARR